MCAMKPAYFDTTEPDQILHRVALADPPSSLVLIADLEVKQFISLCLQPVDTRPSASELL